MWARTKQTARVARLRGQTSGHFPPQKKNPAERSVLRGVACKNSLCWDKRQKCAHGPKTGLHLLSSGLYRRRRICTELLPCGSRAFQSLFKRDADFAETSDLCRVYPRKSVLSLFISVPVFQLGWITVDRELGLPPHPAPKVPVFDCGFIMANMTRWVKYGGLANGDRVGCLYPIPNFYSSALSFSFTERRWGKRMTSRMVSRSVRSIARRSMPMPKPPVGGMP